MSTRRPPPVTTLPRVEVVRPPIVSNRETLARTLTPEIGAPVESRTVPERDAALGRLMSRVLGGGVDGEVGDVRSDRRMPRPHLVGEAAPPT